MIRQTLYKPDGSVEVVERKSKPGLEEMQKLVGGYLQQILPNWCRGVAKTTEIYVDEDGTPKGLPPNTRGSEAIGFLGTTGTILVGNILVLEKI